jgi:ribosome maturation factor RimP
MTEAAILEQIRHLAEPILDGMGLELVDVEFKREGRGWVLRFFIDREGGVTLDDCSLFSREIGTVLDIEETIDRPYHLEVSSPGIDRPLKKAEDFERFKGQQVKLKTFEKMDPDQRGHLRKTFVGELLGMENGVVRLLQKDRKGGVAAIPFDGIAQANLEPEFDF